ncbi:hypothetical protein Pmani_032150 [Petrolisthes manimaculis]|uniref:Uncharacterized protein n=1 Tax=Petrolisthes manimaculis TaxID=1843537 RepID=A0AAE1NTL6_9EUCA|nr:hypothetical protein Pmani_032150 [Petrolisthes manimaculis]
MAPVQSRSFKLLQNVLDTHDTTESPSTGVPMKVEVCPGSPKRTPANINNGPRVFTSATNQGGGGYRVIPVQQQQQQQQGGGDDTRYITPTTKQMGGYKANGSNPNQMSNIFKNQVRVNSDNDEARGRGGYFPAPKTVVVTQRMEPQGPVHIPNLRQPQQQQQQQQPKPFQPNYQQFQNPGVSSNPGASEQEVPEPKKYMGGSIPSRSFRMLQAMTGPDEASDNGAPATEITNTTTQPPDGDKKVHAANHNNHPPPQPQPPSLSSPPPSSSSTTPLLTSTTTTTTNNDMYSSDSGISSPSKVSPTYTTTKDSRVYRNVAPKINVNGSKRERIVNSALTHKEPSSPYSNNSSSSSPTWKVNPATTKFFPPSVSSSSSGQEADRNSPRLMTIIRQESASPQDPPPELTERRYEGGHIPSRVFRHLQSEYPSTPGGEEGDDTNQDSRPRHQGSSPIPPRVIKSLQNQNNANNSFESDASSSYGELDEYYSNGATKTAVNKDTVLKELTSQFDHSLGTRKKPKAAPGRVFKYLQAQYDTPDDPNTHYEPQQQQQQEEEEEVNSLGYRGSKLPSPSFRYLQNQYHQEQQQQQQSVEPPTPDAPNYEDEPMPYRGARTPGRTFRSIQENGAAHPSVFGNRK